jgi:hypothetical protein
MTTRSRVLRTGLLALPLLLLATVAWAASPLDSDLPWDVLSGGGAPAESGSGHVALNGSLGQTAIGPSADTHGSLGAGFWYGLGPRGYSIYLPLVLRKY